LINVFPFFPRNSERGMPHKWIKLASTKSGPMCVRLQKTIVRNPDSMRTKRCFSQTDEGPAISTI